MMLSQLLAKDKEAVQYAVENLTPQSVEGEAREQTAS